MTADSSKNNKQKKVNKKLRKTFLFLNESPEEIVKARLNSLLKNPGLFAKKDSKEFNSKSVVSKEEPQIFISKIKIFTIVYKYKINRSYSQYLPSKLLNRC